jgi:hypothetical protein
VSGYSTWPNADIVLSNGGQIGTPRTITTDGNFLMIGDHNAQGQSAMHGGWVWTSFPTTNEQVPDFFLSENPSTIWPQGAFTSSGQLVTVTDTLHVWNQAPQSSQATPSVSLNTRAYGVRSGDGSDVAVVNGRVYFSDYNGNRILVYNSVPTHADQLPDFALGAPDIYTNTFDTEHFMNNPVVHSDGQSIFLASGFDVKLLGWRQIPADSTTPPDAIYENGLEAVTGITTYQGALIVSKGHPAGMFAAGELMIWSDVNSFWGGSGPDTTITSIGGAALDQVKGICADGQNLYVHAFDDSTRTGTLHVFDRVPTQQSTPVYAISTSGDGGNVSSDGDHVVIGGHQLKVYEVASLSSQATPQVISLNLVTSTSNSVQSVSVGDGHLFVADLGYNRVACWESLDDALQGREADTFLGAESTDDVYPNVGQDSLFWASTLSYDGARLWCGEYKFSGRTVGFPVQ